MSKTTKCYGETLHYSQDREKIEGLSEDMKQLWIDTKLKQLAILSDSKLKPIDGGGDERTFS